MPYCYIFVVFFMLGTAGTAVGEESQSIPEQVYPELEYLFSQALSEDDFLLEEVTAIVDFVSAVPAGTSRKLTSRKGASGAFHSFSVKGDLGHILDYSYNPGIPVYVTMPSSLSAQKWLTPQTDGELESLPRTLDSTEAIRTLRGKDSEVITPDTNTGGYYSYIQDRFIAMLPGKTGPVLISASVQSDVSDVGKKGCVVGDDKDWNYLYSGKTGLNKTGLGWVSSYMYKANSVIVYVADSVEHVVHIGSFKWLDAGWAKMNMVKSSHILNGIKRFASDFKTVLEAPGLPGAEDVAGKYSSLMQSDEEQLRKEVSIYLQALVDAGSSSVRSNPFKKLLSSGEYLEKMSREEMVKVLMLEYVKESIGKDSLVSLSAPQEPKDKG